jgi:hypothetical protein
MTIYALQGKRIGRLHLNWQGGRGQRPVCKFALALLPAETG